MRRRNMDSQTGQGMTEYMIILALVAVTTIGVVTFFGDSIKYQYSKAVGRVLGDSNATQMDKPRISKEYIKRRTLADFEKSAPRRRH